MALVNLDAAEINRIRTYMRGEGAWSHTSDEYQNDILSLIDRDGPGTPGDIVEIGCYLGGLTAQLAYACKAVKKRLIIIDINFSYMGTAATHLSQLDCAMNTLLFLGGFEEFASVVSLKQTPFLFVIDADHHYSTVRKDVRTLLRNYPTAKYAAFHDFSLRHASEHDDPIRVDRGIMDVIGDNFPLTPIGQIAGEGSILRTAPLPTEPHYHQKGISEGVLIDVAAAARAANLSE